MFLQFHTLSSIELLKNEWITFFIFLAAISFLIALSEILRLTLKWSPETTRKLVHIAVGLLMLLSPFLFKSNLQPVTLAVIFLVVNFVAMKSNKLRGMHSISRKTYGTVYFPIGFLILSIFWWDRPVVFEVSLLLLTLSDTAATITGERTRSPDIYVIWKDQKSVQGSIVMFLSSLLLVGFGTTLFSSLLQLPPIDLQVLIPLSLFVAIMASISEAASKAGSDNLTVPFITALAYDLFIFSAQKGELLLLLSWVLASLIFAIIALRLNTLTLSGSIGAFVLGVFIFGIGRWKFMIPMGVFFLVSSLLSKIGQKRKEAIKTSFGKGSKRDIIQVFANGGIPLLLTILWFYSPSEWLYTAYLASVAAATADTWATEIGFFSKRPPRHSISFKSVEPGTSGGVTLLGILGGFLGSTTIAFCGFLFLPNLIFMKTVVFAGVAASIIDSVLGATLQGSYQCDTCKKTTELSLHCDSPTTLLKGTRYLNNDGVNLICTIAGSVLFLLLS